MIVQLNKSCRKCGADEWATRPRGFFCAPCNRKKSAEWRRANPERFRKALANWYQRNREAHFLQMQEWQKTNRERVRVKNARWNRANPESLQAQNARRRALKRKAPGRGVTTVQWSAILNTSLGLCSYCGQRKPLEMDHIEPLSRGGEHDIDNICAVCDSCNSSKCDKPLLVWFAS